MTIELKLDYAGDVKNPENVKKDLKKALRISLLSFLSAAVLTVAMYFLALYVNNNVLWTLLVFYFFSKSSKLFMRISGW